MELQELYTSFLPKKTKNVVRQQYPAPSQIYLSSNMQKLKLLRMENEKKKQNNLSDMNMTTNNMIQNQFESPTKNDRDDIKRSKSFNQGVTRNTSTNQSLFQRNQSIPFEQYAASLNHQQQQLQLYDLNQKNSLDDNNTVLQFQNSLLAQIKYTKNDENKIQRQTQLNKQNEQHNHNRISPLHQRNLYQKSMIIIDQSDSKRNNSQNNKSFSQQPQISLIQNQNIDNSNTHNKLENNNNSLIMNYDQNIYEEELKEYKQFEKKMKDQREKSPMNKYYKSNSAQQQINNQYDKYYPHYQTKIKIINEKKADQKLEEVMGGRMKNYIPIELKNLDPQDSLQQIQRKFRQFAIGQNQNQTDNYNQLKQELNHRIIDHQQQNEYPGQIQDYENNIQFYGQQNNYDSINSNGMSKRFQRRGNSCISSQRPSNKNENNIINNNNVNKYSNSQIIKSPPLSVSAHQNKESIIIPNISQYETTVAGQIQTFVIPLQQNYTVSLNEIDRIKTRRKHLLSNNNNYNSDSSSNSVLQPFNQQNSKLKFLNKISQSRQTPKNYENNNHLNQFNFE